MDILDESFGTQAPETNLDQLVTPTTVANPLPLGAVRNRAATTALLSEPGKAVENYQMLMAENDQGQSGLHQQLTDNIQNSVGRVNMQQVMSILGNKDIPLDMKKKVVENIKGNDFLKDTPTVLHSNALAAGSAGEPLEQEDARLSSADAIRDIYNARTQIQGLVNAHAASLDDASLTTVGDMAALYVLPFGNSISVGKVNKEASAEAGTSSFWNTLKGFILPGSTTSDLREKLANLPPEQRVQYAQQLITAIKSKSGILFSNDNQFAQFDKASSIFEDGGYSDTQAFLDNISPLLDLVGLGQLARGAGKGAAAASKAAKAERAAAEVVHPAEWELVDDRARVPVERGLPNPQKKLTYVEDQVKRIETNAVVARENPASPAKIVQQANPEQARNLHEAVASSDGDEVANALYGTSRQDAIVSDVVPQAITPNGNVTSRVNDIDKNLRQRLQIPIDIVDAVNNSGATYYTNAEKAAARAKVVNDFTAAEGLVVNNAMSSFTVDGGRIQISAVYGAPEGSFKRAEDAYRQATLALRNYGIGNEDIEILRKEGLDHVPVDKNNIPDGDGNYLIRINTYHEIDPTDITNFEHYDVKRNFFDRAGVTVSQNTGSVSRYVFDAASMLHPGIVGPAVVAQDATSKFSKMMLSLAAEYSDKFIGLEKPRQAKVEDYIREANYNGIKFDAIDLIARGFHPDEIDALRSWRKFWDSHFYLENNDVVRTLNSQGYQMLATGGTELYVKPVAKNSNIGKVFDPSLNTVVILNQQELNDLYAKGGNYARLRRPTDFDGVIVDHVIVRNTPTEYTRAFRDSDKVLNYREGYFQIQYKSPRFVEEITRDSTGKISGSRAVAVAGDTREAQTFADRMKSQTGKEYNVRGDNRAMRTDDDAYFDINSAGGRIAQRQRGKLLEDSSGLNHLGDGSYIMSPVDSAVRAATSISGRTVARPMLESAKARFVQQYADVLPRNSWGEVQWPKNKNQIGASGKSFASHTADARTTYEYINYLENGYINSIDTAVKASFNAIAEMAGERGFTRIERGAFKVATSNPTSVVKNSVFMAYIGTNPLRQWIVQPHQILRTWSYNPVGWVNGQIPRYMGEFISDMVDGPVSSKGAKFNDFIKNSGMLDAVDKSNLVRGSLLEAANSSSAAWNAAKKPIEYARMAGFDVGEQMNLLGHAAAVYERYERLGKNLADKAVRDAAYSEIRAISYDMNFAGDMPYNQTTPSMVLQFMQVPHKAALQATNRRIDPWIRTRMIVADAIMWGTPVSLIGTTIGVNLLPDNPKERELFLWGAESMLMNHMLTKLTGEKTNLDFSNLAPYDMTGWGKFFTAMYSGGAQQAIANSPAGQLFLKRGGRAQNAIATMARFFGIIEDVDEEKPTFLEVMNETAKISSGYSNAVKAKLLLDARKRLDQYGSKTEGDVSAAEAWAQLFGFGSADTRDLYRMSQQMGSDNKAHKDEVLKVYEDIKRYYTEKLQVESSDPKWITKVTGRVMKVYENDPIALGLIQHQLQIDLMGKDQALLKQFMQRSGIPSSGNLRDQVKQMPVSDDEKAMMMKRIDDMEAAFKQQKENK